MKTHYAPVYVRNRATGVEMTRAESKKMNAAHRRPAKIDYAARQRRCAKAIASVVLRTRGLSSLGVMLKVDHEMSSVLCEWLVHGQGSLPETL